MFKDKKRLLAVAALAIMLGQGFNFCRGAGSFLSSDDEESDSDDVYHDALPDALPVMTPVDAKKLSQAVPGVTLPKNLQAFQSKTARLNKEISELLKETRDLMARSRAGEYAIYEKEQEFYKHLIFQAPFAIFSDPEIASYRKSLHLVERALQQMRDEYAQNNSEASVAQIARITKAKEDERNSAQIKILEAARALFRPFQSSSGDANIHVRRPVALSPREALIAARKIAIANAEKELIDMKPQEVALRAAQGRRIRKNYSRGKWADPLGGTHELAREHALNASRKKIEEKLEDLNEDLAELM